MKVCISELSKENVNDTMYKNPYEIRFCDRISVSLCHTKSRQHELHSESGEPGDDTLEGNHPHCPSRPILPLDGSDRRDAGRVEQAEGQEGECHARCQKRRESFLRPVEDSQGRDNNLLGHE